MAVLASALLLTSAGLAFTPLEEEGLAFLQRLSSQGYESIYMTTLELELLEPCTLALYTPGNIGGGFMIGMGGTDVLDLQLKLEGEGWALADTLPDDMPVLEISPEEVRTLERVVVTVVDMLRSAPSEEALFMYALEPVDPAVAGDDLQEATEEQGAQ